MPKELNLSNRAALGEVSCARLLYQTVSRAPIRLIRWALTCGQNDARKKQEKVGTRGPDPPAVHWWSILGHGSPFSCRLFRLDAGKGVTDGRCNGRERKDSVAVEVLVHGGVGRKVSVWSCNNSKNHMKVSRRNGQWGDTSGGCGTWEKSI